MHVAILAYIFGKTLGGPVSISCCVPPSGLSESLQIHADLVFLPESTACGQPNTVMVKLLRSALLKVSTLKDKL